MSKFPIQFHFEQDLLISVELLFALGSNDACVCGDGKRSWRDAFLQLFPLHTVWINDCRYFVCLFFMPS